MIVLTLPWPPTVNTYWRHPNSGPLAGRSLLSEDGREYRKAVKIHIEDRRWRGMAAAIGMQRCAVEIDAFPPDARKRDLDNLPKGILDALSHADVWDDDGQIDDLHIRRREISKGGKVVVSIRVVEPMGMPTLIVGEREEGF